MDILFHLLVNFGLLPVWNSDYSCHEHSCIRIYRVISFISIGYTGILYFWIYKDILYPSLDGPPRSGMEVSYSKYMLKYHILSICLTWALLQNQLPKCSPILTTMYETFIYPTFCHHVVLSIFYFSSLI